MNYKLHKLANIILGIERTSIKSSCYKLRVITNDRPVRIENENDEKFYYYNNKDGSFYYDLQEGIYYIYVIDNDEEIYYTQILKVTKEMYNTMGTIDVRKESD